MKKYKSSGTTDMFDELPFWSAPFGLKLLDNIEYKPGITAIDIGFGTGFPLTELAMRLDQKSTVYGIDPSKEAIKRVNEKLEFYGISNVNIIEGEAETISLPDSSVHLIVSNNGINNVSNIDKVLSECSRICKTDGQFVLTLNLNKTMIEFYTPFEEVLKAMKMDNEITLMHQHIYEKRRPLEEVTALIQKHGFTIKKKEEDSFTYKFTNGTTMLNHFFIRNAFMDSWVKLLPANKAGQVFKTLESKLNEQSLHNGSLKLTIPFVMINAYKE